MSSSPIIISLDIIKNTVDTSLLGGGGGICLSSLCVHTRNMHTITTIKWVVHVLTKKSIRTISGTIL